MAAKQLFIMVFVFACSAARADVTTEVIPEQIKNYIGETVPPGVKLVSFEDYTDEASSDPENSTTTTDSTVATVPTTNEAKPSNKKDGGSEGVPNIKDQNLINKIKRETGKEENNKINSIVRETSTSATMSTETSTKDDKEVNYKKTTESVLGISRAQTNNAEIISDRVTTGTTVATTTALQLVSTGTTNKQPYRNSNTAKINGKDPKKNNRDKSKIEKKNEPSNRYNSNNDVYDSENAKSKLDNNEDEDSAQSNEYQIMSSEKQRRRKLSSRGKGRGRQADEKPCDRTKEEVAEPNHVQQMEQNQRIQGIQGAESKILPQVKNNSVTTVLPTNKPSTATAIPTTVKTNTQSTMQPSNNSTTSHPPTKTKSKKWQKALDIIGRVIGVFTVIGGAFYLVYSVM